MSPTRRGSATQAGSTLVEVLVAVVILGTAFAAILGGMSTSSIASDIHRKQATAETVLRSLAEWVKAQPYRDCATTYSTSGFTVPAGYGATITGVSYWSGDPSASDTDFSPSCGSDHGLQRVSLRVVSPNERASETVEILKRRE